MSKRSRPSIKTKSLRVTLTQNLSRLTRYSYLFFIIFVAGLYGFVIYRGQSLQNAEPSDDAVASKVQTTKVLRIDPAIIHQIQALQDNSVNVQTLFDQARNDPFQ